MDILPIQAKFAELLNGTGSDKLDPESEKFNKELSDFHFGVKMANNDLNKSLEKFEQIE